MSLYDVEENGQFFKLSDGETALVSHLLKEGRRLHFHFSVFDGVNRFAVDLRDVFGFYGCSALCGSPPLPNFSLGWVAFEVLGALTWDELKSLATGELA